MGVIENARAWLATDAAATERAAIEARLDPAGGVLAALNAVKISGAQMRAAIAAIEHVPTRGEADALAQARILSTFASEQGLEPADYASAALHARVVALVRWSQAHGPHALSGTEAYFEAAALCHLTEIEDGMAFDPDVFAELVVFIAEFPF